MNQRIHLIGARTGLARCSLFLLANTALLVGCGDNGPDTIYYQNGDGDGDSSNGGADSTPPVGDGDGDGDGNEVVVPGDQVCSTDADCGGDAGVCDPVEGCVDCLFDWDCPAQHRCEDRQCFEKTACKTGADCKSDSGRTVGDAVQ